jgi:hypothetical protein
MTVQIAPVRQHLRTETVEDVVTEVRRGLWALSLKELVRPGNRVAIAVLDLTAHSHGNAIGVGHADLITRRLYDKIDLAATATNCLTSHNLAGGKIPLTLPNDRATFEAGLAGLAPDKARLMIIRNTLELEQIWVSEALLPAVASNAALEQVGPLRSLGFDQDGNMLPLWTDL